MNPAPADRPWFLCAISFVAASMFAIAAAAQDSYPSRPMTLIVPFPPGGVADIVGRPFAEALSRELKTPVIIENKPGAGGGIGMGLVAKAKPDGYTLLLALSSISILPEADKVLGRAPLYQLDQFTPIARLTADPTVLAVRADSPWKTLQDFVDDARKRPGAITYGSSGNYGTMHMPMEMFAHSANVKLLHVPFTGGGPAVIALLGGQVDALSTGPSTVLQHVKAGKVRVLASWGDHPPCVAARREDADRIGLRRRLLPVVGAVRARRNAGADRCAPARSGACRGRRFAVRQHAGDRRDAGPVSRRAGNAALLGSGRQEAGRGGAARRKGRVTRFVSHRPRVARVTERRAQRDPQASIRGYVKKPRKRSSRGFKTVSIRRRELIQRRHHH